MTEALPANLFQIPDLCPICSGPTSVHGDFLYCQNATCPSRILGSLKVWVRNLGLLNIGDATIDALAASSKVSSVADLYRLDAEDWEEFCSGQKMAIKCYTALQESKDIPLELVLASLNIPNFGVSTATDIVQAGFDTVDKLLALGYDDLKSIQNVGEKTARQIEAGLLEKGPLLRDLSTVLNIKKPSSGPLQGKTICITGELSRPRKAVEKIIMEAGGAAKSSVSKGTSYLVTNNPNTGSSKMASAKKHGIPVISESQLYELIESSNTS